MNKLSQIGMTAGALIMMVSAGSCTKNLTFNDNELKIIGTDSTAGIMPLLTVDDPADTALLNSVSSDLSAEDMKSSYYNILKLRMLATVRDTTNEGVGIAAPQVGITKRLVAVQRLDKAGEPFEFYPNIRLLNLSEEKAWGWEGCLSVPGMRDTVLRSKSVVISYIDEKSMVEKRDTVEGFTAVIFQHEIDHLEGILYTERKRL